MLLELKPVSDRLMPARVLIPSTVNLPSFRATPPPIELGHIHEAVDNRLSEDQAGFPRRRGCVDYFFTSNVWNVNPCT